MKEDKTIVDRVIGVIDHTMLKPFETNENVKMLIDEAITLGAYSVCIEPNYLQVAREYIDSKKSVLRIAVVVDFPFGAGTTETRVQAVDKLSELADEIDIVAQIGFVKSGEFNLVGDDLRRVTQAAHRRGRLIKVIVEDAYTTRNEKEKLYTEVMKSGADFIKTGTGFEDAKYASSLNNKTGAQVENVKLMAEISKKYNPGIGIKAAGGVHSFSGALELLEASGRALDPLKFRIGASSTVKIKESAVST